MLYVVGMVHGVTCLDNIMYVVCRGSSTIRLYNTDTFSPLDVVINVDGMRNPLDIVLCRHDRQLYIADWNYCIWRVSVDDKSYVKWLTTESTTDIFTVTSLSLTSRRLIVTSWLPSRRLHQYDTTDTQLLCVVSLPGYVKLVYRGVETTHGTFVVGHWGTAQSEWQDAVSELFGLCYKCYDDDDDGNIVMIYKVITNTRKYSVIIMMIMITTNNNVNTVDI